MKYRHLLDIQGAILSMPFLLPKSISLQCASALETSTDTNSEPKNLCTITVNQNLSKVACNSVPFLWTECSLF